MKLELVKDLIEKAGVATFGQDLFIGQMPLDAQTGVLLRQSYAGTPIDYELPGYYKDWFRVIARAPNYLDAEALADAVLRAITITQERVVGNMLVRYVRPKARPVPFPISDGDLIEFACNVEYAASEV